MGLGGISVWQLLIVLLIVVMIFGTKKLRNMGGDLGSAVKGFKESVGPDKEKTPDSEERVIEGEAVDTTSEEKAKEQTKEHSS